MKNKAFTLVELLAVIIILGVLSTLIIPRVLNSVHESEKSANLTSARNIVKAAKYKVANNESTGTNEHIIINFSSGINTDYLDYKGKKPTAGIVEINADGTIAMAVRFKDSCYLKAFISDDVTVIPFDTATCNENSEAFASGVDLIPGTVKSDGARYFFEVIEVYFNPTAGTSGLKCTEGEEGCLHWYAYSSKNGYLNMLLDHNINPAREDDAIWASKTDYELGLTPIMDGEDVIGYETTEGEGSIATLTGITYPNIESFPIYDSIQKEISRGPLTALKYLKTNTSTWKTDTPKVPNSSNTNEQIIPASENENKYQINYTGYHARLITYNEAYNLGCRITSSVDPSVCPDWMKAGTVGENNTRFADIYGYWTSTPTDSHGRAWLVRYWSENSSLYYEDISFEYYGVRPVITVPAESVLDL